MTGYRERPLWSSAATWQADEYDMITSDAGLDQSIEQLERMYRVVWELRPRMGTTNPAHFQLFVEGPIEEIRRLRHDIDEYLGINELLGAVSDHH